MADDEAENGQSNNEYKWRSLASCSSSHWNRRTGHLTVGFGDNEVWFSSSSTCERSQNRDIKGDSKRDLKRIGGENRNQNSVLKGS